MKIFLFFLLVFSSPLFAEEFSLHLESAPIDRHDQASIKRGAKFFAGNCMSCHTLVYLRYDALAKEAGITYEKMPVNVKQWPYPVPPPDLSLEASSRGVDWIYTYLHSFYVDPKRPSGFNNLLLINSVMPNILAPYQGKQLLAPVNTEHFYHQARDWYDVVELQQQGSMTPEQFDHTMADVVNFLQYAAEPYYEEQQHLAWWVIGFLFILFIVFYWLKKEYWRDL